MAKRAVGGGVTAQDAEMNGLLRSNQTERCFPVGATEHPSVIKGSRMKVRNEADVITSSRVVPQGRNIFTLSQQFIIAGRGFCIMKPAQDKTEVIH